MIGGGAGKASASDCDATAANAASSSEQAAPDASWNDRYVGSLTPVASTC
jgi:hypothetical protein